MIDAVGRRRFQWAGRDCVRIAPPVQQEVLVLHVRKTFRVESHAHKMEVGVEAVDLDGILDIVGRRAVTVVVGIHTSAYGTGIHSRQGIAAQYISRGIASRAQIPLL